MMLRARDFRHRAWDALSGKWGVMAIITLLTMLISSALGGLSVIGVGAIALLLITGPLTLGISQAYLKVVRGENVEIGNMFDGFRNFLKAFLLMLVNEIFIALWSLLFIIPGIIKTYAYSMSIYILADNPDIDTSEARRRSIVMMRGNKWRLFCLDLSFIGWLILCGLTLGILGFWVTPYMGVARAEFYQELLREQGIINGNGNGGAPQNGGQPNQPAGENEQNAAQPQDPFTDVSEESANAQPSKETTDNDGNVPPLNADDL